MTTNDGGRVARTTGMAPVARTIALCVAALTATGCEHFLRGQSIEDALRSQTTNPSKVAESAAKAPSRHSEPGALTFAAPADAPLPNARELTAPYDLVPPFRVECVVGLCDPAFYPSPSAAFGLGVVTRTGAAAEFALDGSRNDGMTATATFGTPTPQSFADAQQLDLAFEHDGSELVGYARDHDAGGAWSEVSRASAPGGEIYLPRIFALNLEPGQMVSFYSLSVRANGPYGSGQVSTMHEIVRKLVEALDRMAVGAESLEDGTPDPAVAELEIRVAARLVDEAFAALAAAAPAGKRNAADRRRKKAQKAGRKAAKRVAQALSRLSESGAGGAPVVVKRVASAALSVAQAGDQLLPDDLRAAVGGLSLKDLKKR